MFKSRLLIFPQSHLFCTLNMAPFWSQGQKTIVKVSRSSLDPTQATHWVREAKAPSLTPLAASAPSPTRDRSTEEAGSHCPLGEFRATSPLRPASRPAPSAPPLAPSAPVCSPAPGVRRSAAPAGAFRTHPHVKRPLFP